MRVLKKGSQIGHEFARPISASHVAPSISAPHFYFDLLAVEAGMSAAIFLFTDGWRVRSSCNALTRLVPRLLARRRLAAVARMPRICALRPFVRAVDSAKKDHDCLAVELSRSFCKFRA